MVKVNELFEKSDWKKTCIVLLAVFSIVSVHVASFSHGVPAPLRVIFNGEMKAEIAISVGLKIIVLGGVARYFPQFLYGVISIIYRMRIEEKYHKRGYKRVYVNYTGIGSGARYLSNAEEIGTHLRMYAAPNRDAVRFSNFVKKQAQGSCFFDIYIAYQMHITATLGSILFVISYLGVLRGILVFLIFVIFGVAISYFSSFSRLARFNLSREAWKSWDGKFDYSIDIDDALLIAPILVIVSAFSGFLRVGFLASQLDAVLPNEPLPVSIISSNSIGLLIARDDGEFEFVTWPDRISVK